MALAALVQSPAESVVLISISSLYTSRRSWICAGDAVPPACSRCCGLAAGAPRKTPSRIDPLAFVMDPAIRKPSFSACSQAILGISRRQREEERAALPRLALRPDLPFVRLHDPLGDGEPQTCALPGGLPPLPEALEDVRELLRGDPGPGVGHQEPGFAIAKLGPDGDRAAFRGELDRIPDQVGEDPEDQRPIAPEFELPAADVSFQAKPPLLGERLHQIQGFAQQSPGHAALLLDRETPGLDPGDVEEILDEVLHRIRRFS